MFNQKSFLLQKFRIIENFQMKFFYIIDNFSNGNFYKVIKSFLVKFLKWNILIQKIFKPFTVIENFKYFFNRNC